MEIVADIARVSLAGVFTVAGVGKLLDLPGSRRTMAAFGLPPKLAARAGTVLPFVELAVAAALILEPTARWGGVAALGLLLVFVGGITNSLARGRTPDCNCFGQLSAKPIGYRTLLRNAALAALAVVVVGVGAGSSLLAWTGGGAVVDAIAIVAVLCLIGAAMAGWRLWRDKQGVEAALVSLRRQMGMLPPGLPVGMRAPGFELSDVRGGTVTLSGLCARGRPVVLLFMSPGCGPCDRLLPELARWSTALADRVTFAVISNGGPDREEIAEQLRATAGDVITLVQEVQEVADTYRVVATPTALVVSATGRIASGSAGAPDEIETLVRLALRHSGGPDVPRRDPVGQAA